MVPPDYDSIEEELEESGEIENEVEDEINDDELIFLKEKEGELAMTIERLQQQIRELDGNIELPPISPLKTMEIPEKMSKITKNVINYNISRFP